MTVILHISDPHFGTEREPVVRALRSCAHDLKPDLLVLSGDITQRARASQFERAARFVRELGVAHVLVIPGNHDVPLFNLADRALRPYAAYSRFFGSDFAPRLQTADCLVLGVKTTRRYRHVDGEISSEQCRQIAAQLRQAAPEQLRVVVLHQPLAVPRAAEQKNVVRGREPAIAEWAEAGADLVLSGHIHLPFVLPLHEAWALPRPMWAVSAGTAVSSRVRYDAPNSVNVIRTLPSVPVRACAVEQWSFEDATSSFRCSAQLRLAG